MLIKNRRSLENAGPRAWNLTRWASAVLLVAAVGCLLAGPLTIASAQAGAPGADANAAASDEPAGEPKAAPKKGAANRLSYNDNSADTRKSIGGSGEIISFTLPDDDAKVAGVRIHGSRYGAKQPPKENFVIYFLNSDLTETVATQTAAYSLFAKGPEKWVEVQFHKPIFVPKEFSVALDFRASQTKGVYVSVDSSTDGSHSRIGLPGIEAKEANVGGDWMIEVVLAK